MKTNQSKTTKTTHRQAHSLGLAPVTPGSTRRLSCGWVNSSSALSLLLLTSFLAAVNPLTSKATAGFTLGQTQQLSRVDQVPEDLSATQWAGIRAAYEAGRHRVVKVENGYHARNPGQQLGACFDGRGFLVQPQNGRWQWGLELSAFGFSGHEHQVARPAQVNAQGQRLV
jgi:hypothetical protein